MGPAAAPERPDLPDWFTWLTGNFERGTAPLRGVPGVVAVQIGAYLGDASIWLAENVLTGPGSVLHDVDTWEGSPGEPEHGTFDWGSILGNYLARTAGLPIVAHRMASDEFFARNPDISADLVYIDGDHTREQVARDGGNAHRILRPGGILAFDDYQWHGHPAGQNPGDAIDEFLEEHGHGYEVMITGAQVWLRKKGG